MDGGVYTVAEGTNLYFDGNEVVRSSVRHVSNQQSVFIGTNIE